MKLEIGKHYLNASGEVVKIYGKESDMFLDSSGNGYFDNGKVRPRDKISVYDLIAEIPKELHQYLIQTIKGYHTDSDFKATVDNIFGDK